MYLPKSKRELEVIKGLMEYPERDWLLKDLSEETEIVKTTVWRVVNRLADKGYIEKEKKGNTLIVRVKNRDVLRNILERSYPENRALNKAAKDFVKELKELKGVDKCILFGSVARGTADLDSDIDILILLKKKDESLEEEIRLIANKINSKKSVRIVPDVMEKERFEKMKKHGESFAKTIEKEGLVLHEAGSDE